MLVSPAACAKSLVAFASPRPSRLPVMWGEYTLQITPHSGSGGFEQKAGYGCGYVHVLLTVFLRSCIAANNTALTVYLLYAFANPRL